LHLNPDPFDFPHSNIIVAAVVKVGGFGVLVTGHAVRDTAAALGAVTRFRFWQGEARILTKGKYETS